MAPHHPRHLPRATQKGKLCLLESSLPYRKKGQLLEAWRTFLSVVAVCYINWRVGQRVKGLCPRGVMSSIGKYKRNLLDLQTTKLFFYLSQVLNILQLGFMATIPQTEKNFSAESIFWIYNSAHLFIFGGELVCQILVIIPVYQILSNTSSTTRKAKFFMTKLPKMLEPKRDHVATFVMQTYPKQKVKILKPWKGKGIGKGNSNKSLPPVQ